mmetsp:Transcript_2023/g.4500  ORF Transcript_2023/g.4500 Transcript_2023/m.4500 type:complete len:356 (-) Transcript_2023:31-1098(-)
MREVTAHRHQQVARPEGFVVLFHVFQELGRPLLDVVVIQPRIVLYELVSAHMVGAEARRRAVVVGHAHGVDAAANHSIRGVPWVHHHLQRTVIDATRFLLVVHSCEEPSVEAHECGEVGVGGAVAEGIDLPADGRSQPEGLEQKEVAEGHLLDHVAVVCGSFVVHTPSAIDKLQPPSHDQPVHLPLLVAALLAPPTPEEAHLDVGELTIRVGSILDVIWVDGVGDCVENHRHIRPLDAVVQTHVVLVHSLEPPDVIVCVMNQMDSHHIRLVSPPSRLPSIGITRRLLLLLLLPVSVQVKQSRIGWINALICCCCCPVYARQHTQEQHQDQMGTHRYQWNRADLSPKAFCIVKHAA